MQKKQIIFRTINKHDNNQIHLQFNGLPIAQVEEQKFLGVWFNEELTWTTHINKLKLSRVVGCMHKIAIPNWLVKNLYYSLFYSMLWNYGMGNNHVYKLC